MDYRIRIVNVKKENTAQHGVGNDLVHARFPSESFAMEKLLDEMEEVFAINESDPVNMKIVFSTSARIMDRTTYAEGLNINKAMNRARA